MDKLRGTGTTFSTSGSSRSGKRWWPFAYGNRNRKVAARIARLRRLIAAGKLKPMTKEQMRELIAAHTDTETSLPHGSS